MSAKTSPPIIKIKKELPNDEIKDFAETAMNELLGWYGYDNVDRMEFTNKGSSRSTTMTQQQQQHHDTTTTSRKNFSHNNNNNSSNNNNNSSNNNNHNSNSNNGGMNGNGLRQRSLSPNDRLSSRESSKSPLHLKIVDNLELVCAWCRRPIQQSSAVDNFGTQDGPRYCSESCFAQSRRASFKRAKTCDWCRHVRHAVSYVDFQDGMSQLQFCSDKCLNQYKMQIFCKETQAHLEMNPHLKEKGKVTADNLITPDLWMKNCRSRSISPESDRSQSLSPHPTIQQPLHNKQPEVGVSKPPIHKPLISVAPPSKLMSRHSLSSSNKIQPKNLRKRRPMRNLSSSSSLNSIISKSPSVIPPSNHGGKPCTVTSAQDLRVNIQAPPEKSPIRQDYQYMGQQPHQPPQLPPNMFIRPPPHMGQSMPQSPRYIPSQMPPNPQHHPFSLHNEPPRLPPFGQNPPPITILVPYPVVIPLPIPIPIPFPVRDYVNALHHKNSDENNKNRTLDATDKCSDKLDDEPLDFTKSSRECENDEIEKFLLESKMMAEQAEKEENELEDEKSKLEKRPASVSPPPQSSSRNVKTPNNELPVEKPVEQKLPKLKITRLDSKRMVSTSNTTESTLVTNDEAASTSIPSKESESSRPLRKRRRVFNCENKV